MQTQFNSKTKLITNNSSPYHLIGTDSDCDSAGSTGSCLNLAKTKSYCVNCGNYGHVYKKCHNPITSYGILLIDLDFEQSIKDQVKTHLEGKDFKSMNNSGGININSDQDIELFGYVKNCIKFLMIQRKHTLGFMEFIRGKYSLTDIKGISYLFKQMTSHEITKIKTISFEKLWNDLWGRNKNKLQFRNEYLISSKKFHKLKNLSGEWLNLDYYIDKIKPTWNYAEWGFPKGRRNRNESDIDCALREFQEETNYCTDDIDVLEKTGQLKELFIGTNGVPYKHIYYLGLLDSDKSPDIDLNNYTQCQEIGDISFLTYEECISIIRPYHVEKKKLITNLYMTIINFIIQNFKGHT